ncbi:MAG: hypothetical protein WBP93_21350 [Pyrinomonadaceae bacterium]
MAVGRINLKKVVMDTSPLFSAMTLSYIRSNPRERNTVLQRNRLEKYFQDYPDKERDFLQLFERIQTVLTTSHVIGEIQGLQKLTGRSQREFWLSSLFILKRKGIEENLLRLLDMNEENDKKELICTIGPTDAGLIALAQQERCVLLTDDGPLTSFARAQGVDCWLTRDILGSA